MVECSDGHTEEVFDKRLSEPAINQCSAHIFRLDNELI